VRVRRDVGVPVRHGAIRRLAEHHLFGGGAFPERDELPLLGLRAARADAPDFQQFQLLQGIPFWPSAGSGRQS
jgi:hypothetical protein